MMSTNWPLQFRLNIQLMESLGDLRILTLLGCIISVHCIPASDGRAAVGRDLKSPMPLFNFDASQSRLGETSPRREEPWLAAVDSKVGGRDVALSAH